MVTRFHNKTYRSETRLSGIMSNNGQKASLPADLHSGKRGGRPGGALHVGQQGGVLDPKCGTSILHFTLDRHVLEQVPGL